MDSCPAVEETRATPGRSRASAFKYYILGLDKTGVKVDLAAHLQRGASLRELTEVWLSTWDDNVDV